MSGHRPGATRSVVSLLSGETDDPEPVAAFPLCPSAGAAAAATVRSPASSLPGASSGSTGSGDGIRLRALSSPQNSGPMSGAYDDPHERHQLSAMMQTPLDSVVIPSKISLLPPSEQGKAILDAFNAGVGSDRALTATRLSCRPGERIEQGHFMLAHRNGVPELAPYNPLPLTTCFSFYLPGTKIEKLGVYKQNHLYYGAHGSYVVNVPHGKYAQVYFGQTAKLLGQGAHVFQDPTFRLARLKDGDDSSAFVDVFTSHIKHGPINIIRVPIGKVAKAWFNTTTPHLLYPRPDGAPFIVNDPLFRLDGIVSQLDPVIQHGIIFILRIPSGHLCKAWKGSQAIILESRPEPYEFHDPVFRLDDPRNPFGTAMSEPYIRHMNIHRLRIPAGKIAKVWQENTPLILQSREESYEFDSPFFRLAPADPTAIDGHNISTDPSRLFEDAFKPYISHGVLHMLRVPSGKIARVWDGAKAMLLEYRAEPYFYNSPLFRLEPASNQQVLRRVVNSLGLAEEAKYSEDRSIEDANTSAAGAELFEDATSPCIVHGSIKRLQPRTGEVCLCYENGQLVIREPPTNGKPIYIDDENCRVDGFISVGVQTLVFPSDETKALRKRENAAITTEEMNYEIFTTKDSLRVGVKLLVAFKIVDARKAIMELTRNGIVKHVENCCVVDMGKSIQACSSRDFLSSAHNNPKNASANNPGSPSLMQHFQDTVKIALAADLAEFGIELVRLNFETPKILDQGIAKQMAEQALSVAAVSSQEAVMKQQADIARVRADQAATVVRIAQEQENANKLSIARTAKEAAQLEADAILIKAEAAHSVQKMEGRQFDEHPSLLQIKLAQIQSAAIANAKISMVIAPEKIGQALSIFGNMPQFMTIAGLAKQQVAPMQPQQQQGNQQ